MNLQLAFLLTFLAGGLSVWVLMRMSKQTEQERMNIINKQISNLGGSINSIDLVAIKDIPFGSEYKNPDSVYKYYKISYDVEHELKQCWAVLEVKQNSFWPSSAINTNWTWRY